jgi:cytidylate kinase
VDKAGIITIDGPGGSGKSTVAAQVAARLGYAHLDSGALYRALTCWAMAHAKWDEPELAGLVRDGVLAMTWGRVSIHDRDLTKAIRTPEVSAQVYRVADLPLVRKAVNAFLRDLAARRPSVAEGRDMGTEAFPEAPLKVYLDAHPEARARRRAGQGTGETPEALAERVQREIGRKVGGLRPAEDALEIDATDLTPEAVVTRILAVAAERGLVHA